MLKIWKIFLIISNLIFFIARPCLAGDVTYIELGTKAPYSGYLFTPEKTQETRQKLIDGDTYKSLNESLQKSLDFNKQNLQLIEEKNTLLSNQNDNLAKRLYDERQMSDWTKAFWFGAGVIASILITYGIKKANQ